MFFQVRHDAPVVPPQPLRSEVVAGNDPVEAEATTPAPAGGDEPSGSGLVSSASGARGGRTGAWGMSRAAGVDGTPCSTIPLFDVETEVQRKVLDLVSCYGANRYMREIRR